jgi:O-antigen/teichoic acid export membrane protein
MTTWIVFGSKLFAAAVGFVISILIARILGTEGRAEYFLTATLAGGVFALVNLSLNLSVFWCVAERRMTLPSLTRRLLPIALGATAVGVAAYLAAAFGTEILEQAPRSTALAGVALVVALMFVSALDGVLYASDRARAASLSLITTTCVQLVAILIAALLDGLDSTSVLWISAGSAALGALPSVVALSRMWGERRPAPEPDGAPQQPQYREILRPALTGHPGSVAMWLALRVDVLIVSVLVTEHELGVYTLAVTISELTLLATSALALRAVGRQGRLEREASVGYSISVATDSARVAGLQAAALAMIGWPLILVAFGKEWLDAYPVLLVMLPGLVALAYLRPMLPAFVRNARSHEVSVALVAGAFTNVVGTLVAVPPLGLTGAGLASTAGYCVATVVIVWRTWSTLGTRPWARSALPILRGIPRRRAPVDDN